MQGIYGSVFFPLEKVFCNFSHKFDTYHKFYKVILHSAIQKFCLGQAKGLKNVYPTQIPPGPGCSKAG